MSDKYIDLYPEIVRMSLPESDRNGIAMALHWLDAHRDQVPGRTITESEFNSAYRGNYRADGDAQYLGFLARLGITVVPDPVPTIPVPTEPGARFIAYSPKLSDGPEDQREFVIAGKYVVALDTCGVYSRELFAEAEWTVTALVEAPEAGGNDE